MVYVTSFTLTAVLVGSMLTLALSNGVYNKFHFGSCSCQLYVNFSCELMCLHVSACELMCFAMFGSSITMIITIINQVSHGQMFLSVV